MFSAARKQSVPELHHALKSRVHRSHTLPTIAALRKQSAESIVVVDDLLPPPPHNDAEPAAVINESIHVHDIMHPSSAASRVLRYHCSSAFPTPTTRPITRSHTTTATSTPYKAASPRNSISLASRELSDTLRRRLHQKKHRSSASSSSFVVAPPPTSFRRYSSGRETSGDDKAVNQQPQQSNGCDAAALAVEQLQEYRMIRVTEI